MAYAPHELVAQWLYDAALLQREAGTSAATANKLKRARADQLTDCAKALELYHHQNNHDAEWVTHGCPHCARERGEA